jgi:hypothetical protein
MSTIASLVALMDPEMRPYAQGVKETTDASTGLLRLAEMKRQQETEARLRQFYQQHPDAALGPEAGSVLGSLGSAPSGPPPMMQQAVMPGQPPGAPQMVPGGQDLSRFATQGGPDQRPRGFAPEAAPPQSTIAGLGPAGQPPPQPDPQARLRELMRTDPDAAFAVMDQQTKRFTTQLSMREKTAEAFASALQGVTSQEQYEGVVQDLQSFAPQQASRLPRVWSKEAMQPIIQAALSAKEKATLQIAELNEQTDLRKQQFTEQQAAAGVPKYTEDSTLNVAIDRRMQQAGMPRGTPPPERILTQAQEDVQQGKVDVSAAQGAQAATIERTEKPLEGEAGKAVSDLTTLRKLSDDVAALRHDDYTGPVVGRTGYLREQAGTMKQQETAFRATIKNMTDMLARLRSGAAIPPEDMSRLEALVPSVNDHPATFVAKLQNFQRAVEQQRETRLQVGTTARGQLREEMKPTTPRVGEKPTGQGSAGGGASGAFKPLKDMSREERQAERDALRAKAGR